MDAATESRRTSKLFAGLAGLQAGMVGACWMLFWLGVSAVWLRRSFWAPENLMASAFYGTASIHSGFATHTISGLALYLLIYSLLGALFAVLVNDRVLPVRVFLLSLVFALGWYYLAYGLLWKSLLPLVALLHPAQSTAVGHLIFGALLGRYPSYLAKDPEAEKEIAVEEPAVEETHPGPGAES